VKVEKMAGHKNQNGVPWTDEQQTVLLTNVVKRKRVVLAMISNACPSVSMRGRAGLFHIVHSSQWKE
jgi:hypothetical protein